jgi:hypothetical protein
VTSSTTFNTIKLFINFIRTINIKIKLKNRTKTNSKSNQPTS